MHVIRIRGLGADHNAELGCEGHSKEIASVVAGNSWIRETVGRDMGVRRW